MIARQSLKKRLLIYLLSLIAFVWMAIAVSSYFSLRSEMQNLLDTQISQIAYALLEINFENIENYEAIVPAAVGEFLDTSGNLDIRYQIWQGGKLVVHSLEAPKTRLDTPEGFSDLAFSGEDWRILYLVPDKRQKIEIYVLANKGISATFIDPLVSVIGFHLGLQILAMIAIIWFAVQKGLFPLKQLAANISRKSYNDLSPLDQNNIPEEIHPITDALNKLFARLRTSFESEKQFTNHAAHELRTPLAALKMQAQVAMREKDPDKQRKQLQNIVLGVNRATHLVSQLLSIARLEPESEQKLEMKEVALYKIIRSVVGDIEMLSAPKNIKFHLPEPLETDISGDPASLEILVKNLLDNAVRYSPKNSNIYIRLHDMKERLELVIDDEGPGIPEHLREKVFDRFYRIPGSKSEGIGIGLSIVRKSQSCTKPNWLSTMPWATPERELL